MALAVSQAVKIETASGTSVTTNGAITFAAAALAVVNVSAFGGTGSTYAASDNVNGAYTMKTAQDVGASAVRLGYKENVASGSVNLTADGGVGANGVVGLWHEVTGAATASAFGEESGTTGTSTAPDTVNLTNTVAGANAVYFGAMASDEGGNPIGYTINASGSEGTWIEKDATNSKELNANSFPACGVVYQIVASVSARSHTWTTSTPSAWAAAAATFKQASASAAPFVTQLTGSSATGYPFPISARTYLNPLELQLIGKDKFFGAAGEVQPFDWPLPKPYPTPISARTHLDPLKLQLLGKDQFFGAPGMGPDYDWPLPKPYPIPISARTHLDPLKVNLLGKDQFFDAPGQAPTYDWPLPKPYPTPVSARTWLNSTYLEAGKDQFFTAPGEAPTYAWPLPQAYLHPISARTWLQSLNLLAGKDQFFGAPGMGPSYTWPLPLTYAFPVSARTWLVNLLDTTLGVVAGPRQAFDAWPLQPGYAFPLSGRTWLNTLLETTLRGAGMPTHVYATWPVPMAYQFPLSGRTWLVNLLESTLGVATPPRPQQSPRAARYQWSFHDSSMYR